MAQLDKQLGSLKSGAPVCQTQTESRLKSLPMIVFAVFLKNCSHRSSAVGNVLLDTLFYCYWACTLKILRDFPPSMSETGEFTAEVAPQSNSLSWVEHEAGHSPVLFIRSQDVIIGHGHLGMLGNALCFVHFD